MHSVDPDDAINYCPTCAEKIAWQLWEFKDYGAVVMFAIAKDVSVGKAVAMLAEERELTVVH